MAEKALQKDLRRIAEASNSSQDESQTLCLYRVVSGIDLVSWSHLRDELVLDGWHTAPTALLAQNFAPQAAEVQDRLLHQFLLCEMDRARHCQQPLALALIEPESSDAMSALLSLALSQLRSFDHASLLSHGLVAVVLSGTPLASAERLLGSLLRRIRQTCAPSLVCSAGLVGYGGLAELTPQALIACAQNALADARRLGGNRLEVAPSADAALASRETLVHANEKHFLFTGKKMPE